MASFVRNKLLQVTKFGRIGFQTQTPIGCRSSWFARKDEDEVKFPDMMDEDDEMGQHRHSKERLNHLNLHKSIDTKRSYMPPSDVEERIQLLAENVCECSEGDWQNASIKEPLMKYKFLTKCITEFDHDVPNVELTDMKTVADAVEFYKTEVRTASNYESLPHQDLPPNLVVRTEYMRFNPDTDTMFDGKTAFVGRDTIVPSIKYKRKYKPIKNTKEKPGYVDYYHGY